jgi:tRNA threonylcarbamoyladenosine biosynthesis protein TsaB
VLLAIDTSAAQCAVALDTGAAVFVRREAMAKGHAEALFPMIDAVLSEAGAAMADIGRIAVCTGPGSFTGVRIGVAAARGLALGLGAEAVGVTRLEALAEAARAHAGGHPVAVILAARPGVAFLQVFDADGTAQGTPEMVSLGAAEGAIPKLAVRVGDAGLVRSVLDHGLPDPAVIARLGAACEPGEPPAPLYLREADAALPREAPPPILDA